MMPSFTDIKQRFIRKFFNKSYLRYSDDFKGFKNECYEQSSKHNVVMTDDIAKHIWDGLQRMDNPNDFTFNVIANYGN